MEDLGYILNLGFSGTDVWRAVTLSFVLGMFVSRKRPIYVLAFWALIIDRVIWPIGAQASAGAELHTIYASIGALFQTFVDDIGLYLVRYLGIITMMGIFVFMRMRIHKPYMKKMNPSEA